MAAGAAIGITGGLENKWMVSLRAPSFVPPIPVQPLTVLPGEVVPILPPGLNARVALLANRRGKPRDPFADPLRRRRRERQPHEILAAAVHEERFARQRR